MSLVSVKGACAECCCSPWLCHMLFQMSFEAADAESRDLSDLTEQQLKTLGEWEAKLDSKYPVVGTLPYQK